MKKKNKVIAIVGPTGSGKTALAVRVAKMLGTEIISADSRQIYKDFDIAVAKPSLEEQNGVVHHLIGIVEPTEDFSVADFKDKAEVILENLFKQGKVPVVCGGTGLYFRILLENYEMPRVAPDKELREKLENVAKTQGVEVLYDMLCELDFEIAQKIHKNNTVKIIRAIEVCKNLGMPMSKAQKVSEQSKYDVLWIGLTSDDRQFLYDRTDLRVDQMIQNGLENETKCLFDKYAKNNILLNTIGYQEFEGYFEHKISFQEAVEQMKQNTRRYVKRQLTWFRKNKDTHWLDIKLKSSNEIFEEVSLLVEDFLQK